jgi:hypothetical protein
VTAGNYYNYYICFFDGFVKHNYMGSLVMDCSISCYEIFIIYFIT